MSRWTIRRAQVDVDVVEKKAGGGAGEDRVARGPWQLEGKSRSSCEGRGDGRVDGVDGKQNCRWRMVRLREERLRRQERNGDGQDGADRVVEEARLR